MALVLDTGPVVAALNGSDPDHSRCAALIEQAEDLVIPGAALVEIDYWLVKLGGARVWAEFIADIERGAYRVLHPTDAELIRAAELERIYDDLRLGFVDASIIALCERLGQETVATLDRRHFAVVRPRHCSSLTLVPE
jgi:predicted nucleic acid-binding protein